MLEFTSLNGCLFVQRRDGPRRKWNITIVNVESVLYECSQKINISYTSCRRLIRVLTKWLGNNICL